MKVGLRNLPSLVSAYQYLEVMTSCGHEPLEFSPTVAGVNILFKLQNDSSYSAEVFELSDSIMKAYLGLDPGQVQSFVAVVEFVKLSEAFQLSIDAEAKGILVHEIRHLKGSDSNHHLILSHKSEPILKQYLVGRPNFIFSTKNEKMMEFLGFSNIAIDGEL